MKIGTTLIERVQVSNRHKCVESGPFFNMVSRVQFPLVFPSDTLYDHWFAFSYKALNKKTISGLRIKNLFKENGKSFRQNSFMR